MHALILRGMHRTPIICRRSRRGRRLRPDVDSAFRIGVHTSHTAHLRNLAGVAERYNFLLQACHRAVSRFSSRARKTDALWQALSSRDRRLSGSSFRMCRCSVVSDLPRRGRQHRPHCTGPVSAVRLSKRVHRPANFTDHDP